jgi:hypothetical protein
MVVCEFPSLPRDPSVCIPSSPACVWVATAIDKASRPLLRSPRGGRLATVVMWPTVHGPRSFPPSHPPASHASGPPTSSGFVKPGSISALFERTRWPLPRNFSPAPPPFPGSLPSDFLSHSKFLFFLPFPRKPCPDVNSPVQSGSSLVTV